MMKKKRTISIKDPRLRKFRNNLRLLLLELTSAQLKRCFEERHKLHMDLDGNYRNLSESKKPRAGELTKRMREINMLVEVSIIQCPACKRSDRDMTFNAELRQWFCSQCYREMEELYYQWQRKEGRAKRLLFDDFNEEFYKTFLD